jgi:hypothetical protein
LNDFVIRVVASITNQSQGGNHGRESMPEVARKVVPLRASADANSRMQFLAGKPRNLP